ncbi:ATP phosphoribosyltransferase regulatory subunit [Chelatococcus sambhunathii]|uniref:ATP phosphoribosyltransferase regulatory subunit n=1 Tax=Chelatococcus sambhunathii TaxID=363953 RepID=A0ABU1DHD6_9HYPH|nr:ATP phosphoribosyltransferase regulatory subunit [Chelatococcus sambhunathii]MDR4307530.1 ATP phosphoribosyltransferase regulatory subunit [Chelatococcus sambhunathii]
MSRKPSLPQSIVDRLVAAGFARAEPDVLQPAEPFLDVMGEELRQRIFLTADAAGRELCLRPDFTIPTALLHMRAAGQGGAASYFYEGPVFRHGANGGEAPQAGVEMFGRADALAAETEALSLALEASAALGVPAPLVRLGDRAIVEAAVDALDAPAAFRGRVRRALRRGGSVEELATPRPGETEHAGLFAALASAGPDAGRAVIEDLLSLAGIAAVGGRTAGEIAERFLERTAANSVALAPQAKRMLGALLAVDDLAPAALDTLRRIAEDAAPGVRATIARLGERLDAFRAKGLPVDAMRFSIRFGRGLDYYDGLIFELVDGARATTLAGGGRYDGLLTALGSPTRVTGVGFALWLGRFPEAGR